MGPVEDFLPNVLPFCFRRLLVKLHLFYRCVHALVSVLFFSGDICVF